MAAATLQTKARIALAALVAGCLALLVWAQPGTRIATDVLELIPANERDPQLALIRSLAGEQRARIALFALRGTKDEAPRTQVAEAFVASLRASPAFSQVVPLHDAAARDALGRHLFERRFDLLLPAWLANHRAAYARTQPKQAWPEWLAAQAAAELQAFLVQPEAMAFEELLPADPLLLVPNLVGAMKSLDVGQAEPGGPLLIWAMLAQPPLREEGQGPVFAAVERATAEARQIDPSVRLRWTSLARFAAASRQRIETELSTLNAASLAAVLLMAAACLRQMFKVVHLAPVILGSTLIAWTAVLVAFPRVHVLVFVVGALLTGVAVDYGVYLYLQPPATPAEPYAAKAGRLLRPLLGSAVTAVLGFALLVFSDLPLIRQLGVFVSAGLLGAVVVALLWFAQVREPFVETRAFVRARPQATPRLRWLARGLLLLGAAVGAIGPWRLVWRDNIRELDIPAVELQAEAHEVRTQFGERDEGAIYLTRGATAAAARDALERFLAWHATQYPGQPVASAGQVLPTVEAWQELALARTELAGFPALLVRALVEAGFEPEPFQRFTADWDAWRAQPPADYEATARALAAAMTGPLSSLFSVSVQGVWFVSIVEHRADRDPPADLGTASASQLQNLNQLFSRYRRSALTLSLVGLGLVGLSVLVIYGWRHGLTIFAVPVGACFFTFGVFGLAGQPLNLFHLLGAFLGVCLSHNYSIFSAESRLRAETPPPSIRLSAFSTVASFAVLTFSQIPVVAALGSTVALSVFSALAIVELKACAELTAPRAA